MKYMTFNNSCSYAGICNMLEGFDINIEDYELALYIGIPYYFFKDEDGNFLTGPLFFQTKKYFDIYLNDKNLSLNEEFIHRKDVPSYLINNENSMIGIKYGRGKHAVIFKDFNNGKFIFLNNTRINSEEPEFLYYTEEELLNLIEDRTVISNIVVNQREYSKDESFNKSLILDKSKKRFKEYKTCIRKVLEIPMDSGKLAKIMDSHFRCLLLDGIEMMKLIGEDNLVDDLKKLQGNLLLLLRTPDKYILRDKLDCDLLLNVLERYESIINGRSQL